MRSWKVFAFIMVALGAASRARLERYRDKIVALNAKYGYIRGNSWWIIALADQRMRSERMERLRRELEAAAASGGAEGSMGFDPRYPWDAVFLKAASDSEYWQSEVAEVALLYASRVKERSELADPGHHVGVAGEAGEREGSGGEGGRGEGSATNHQRRERGRRLAQELAKLKAEQKEGERRRKGDKGKPKGGKAKGKGKSRVQVCYAWNRDDAGCPTPCPNGRAHVCEVCSSSEHKGKDCTRR